MKNEIEEKQFIVIKSEDNSCLIKKVLDIQRDTNDNIMFLSHKEISFVKDSFEDLIDKMDNFFSHYEKIRFMFLKDSWINLDKMYGKTFFINEIQKMMKEEEFSTIYFHRADTFLEGCTQRDIERICSDVIEIARYYNKRVIFSINEQTRLGQILDEVLYSEVDIAYIVSNTNNLCDSSMQYYKKDKVNVVLFSDRKEVIHFHTYLFKKDSNINFKYISTEQNRVDIDLDDVDIIIFALHNIPIKDKLLSYIKQHKLKTKFLFLSADKIIRKRDKINKMKKGISLVFEKNFDLLEYIYSIEKIIGRDFYTSTLKKVNISPKNHFITDINTFKNVVYNFSNYYIYFSVIAVEYKNSVVKQSVVENLIRDLDVVFYDKPNNGLVFLLVDILPSLALELIEARLKSKGIEIASTQTFDAKEFSKLMDIDKKREMEVTYD